jgi:amino acid permease
MNTVILTSVLSAGNHALFAGTRVLYSLSVTNQAPRFISRLNRRGVPYIALLMTASISGLCFGSSFVGSGALWGWLQNLVGVSNQVGEYLSTLINESLILYPVGLGQHRNSKLPIPKSLGSSGEKLG